MIIYQVPQFKFYEEIKKFEKIDANDDRRKKAREIYDTFIMRELLSNSGKFMTTQKLDIIQHFVFNICRFILKRICRARATVTTKK